MYIADLHIHSKYSRATSRDCDACRIWTCGPGARASACWARAILPTPPGGPSWPNMLEPAEEGLYTPAGRTAACPATAAGARRRALWCRARSAPSIRRDGKTRKVHHRHPAAGSGGGRSALPPAGGHRQSSIPTAGPFWGWTAATCWKSRWTAARRPFSSPPISGRRTFRSSGRFPAFRRHGGMLWRPVAAISTRWKPAFPPTRP